MRSGTRGIPVRASAALIAVVGLVLPATKFADDDDSGSDDFPLGGRRNACTPENPDNEVITLQRQRE